MKKNEKKQMTRKEFEEQVIKKAQSDKEFKKTLVDNPKEIFGQLGVRIMEDVEVKVVEESAKVVYLVLPYNPEELTDEQLAGVTGGGCGSYVAGMCTQNYTSDSCSGWWCNYNGCLVGNEHTS
ncbi:MAG: NHLP leader peptide family RiPP precursor [Syntrophomonas sp.]